jgi:hypothetical protein
VKPTNKRILAQEAMAARRELELNPLAAPEVELDTAELMGAFEETAVSLDDIEQCEPGALDWFFALDPSEAAPRPTRGGRGLLGGAYAVA